MHIMDFFERQWLVNSVMQSNKSLVNAKVVSVATRKFMVMVIPKLMLGNYVMSAGIL